VAVDPLEYRKIIGGFATGVSVVTATHNGDRYGMTANSLTSVSLEPLLLLVCFVRGSQTGLAVQESGYFGVNLLDASQQDLSNRFASSAASFDGVDFDTGDFDLAFFPGGLGRVTCRVHEVVAGGDHDIVIGEVLAAEGRDGDPLLYFRGKYRAVVPAD
jgi:flavin reductase (DIM6/NTAB) family NADH-FMN oxidoreductase RutF